MTAPASAAPPDGQASRPVLLPNDEWDRPRAVTERTNDYWLALLGSLAGSLGLVWMLYEQILPFSDTIGFLISWFVVYLVMFAGVTALAHPAPIVIDRLWTAAVSGAAGVVGAALVSVVVYTTVKGWPALHHLNFFIRSESAGDLNGSFTQGGILNAIEGSLIELGIATGISLPLGIGTAIYMVEVGGSFAKIVRTVVEAMTALPDIIAGLFIYTFLIISLGFQRSGFAAGVALSVMMLPIIARSAYVQLRVVPGGLREASLALGSTQWRTVWQVVLPTQRSGLATAVILGMARAIGETAPVLIASGFSTFSNVNILNNPMNSLPLAIYTAVRSGEPNFITRGFATATVLLAIVLVLFTTTRILARSKAVRR